MSEDSIRLLTTKPEAEIAADVKARLEAALLPVLAIMDEAAQHGLLVRWDAIAPSPFMKHRVVNLRLERHYT